MIQFLGWLSCRWISSEDFAKNSNSFCYRYNIIERISSGSIVKRLFCRYYWWSSWTPCRYRSSFWCRETMLKKTSWDESEQHIRLYLCAAFTSNNLRNRLTMYNTYLMFIFHDEKKLDSRILRWVFAFLGHYFGSYGQLLILVIWLDFIVIFLHDIELSYFAD